jgi:5-methylcytosine-specific restriction enzyme subunit McrC
MEKVFERYVEICLRRSLPSDAVLTPSASAQFLCSHKREPWFLLKPDFLIQRGRQRWVLDTKWKRLDESRGGSVEKYGLSQADFYQLYAYGQRYLEGQGTMLLVYPKTSAFQAPLGDFAFSNELRLRVVPFDLEIGRVVGGALQPESLAPDRSPELTHCSTSTTVRD